MNKKPYTIFLIVLYVLMILIYAWLFPQTLDNGWAYLRAFSISAIVCIIVLLIGLFLTVISRKKIKFLARHWVFVVIAPIIVTVVFFMLILSFGKLSGC